MFSVAGWINGVTSVGVFIFGSIIGFYFIYESIKFKVKLLTYLGLTTLFLGLMWIQYSLDFFTILMTGNNLDEKSLIILTIMGWMFLPLVGITAMYISGELLIPDKKWYLIGPYIGLGILYELILFLDPMGSLIFLYPVTPGEDLVDKIVVYGTPIFILQIIFLSSIIIIMGFGMLSKGIQSKGIIRKKFLVLSIGTFILGISGAIESFILPGIAIIFVRSGLIGGTCIMYLSLRETPSEPKKVSKKKEVRVEESLFRLYERPPQITEEEVSISKEKQICLVCKGKVEGFNFICLECKAFYCQKCAQALIQLENACWVCNSPIDKSKPVKIFKEEEEKEKIRVEKLKK